MKFSCSVDTPVGKLWLAEENGLITQLGFGRISDAEERETAILKRASLQLSEYFEGKRCDFDLPLYPRGTAFQKSVWSALCCVPYGETRSYKDIAIAVGKPKGFRAVGMANNRNPIAVLIPCHRIVGADGSLTGYAGGLEVKHKLLELEQKFK